MTPQTQQPTAPTPAQTQAPATGDVDSYDEGAALYGEDADNDGSTTAAVQAMSGMDLDNLEGGQVVDLDKHRQPRDPKTQQFKPNDPKGQPAPLDAQQVDPAAVPPAQTSAVEEEFFEFQGAEGEEPTRIPATEVLQGYQAAHELAAEVRRLQTQATPPEHWDQEINRTIMARNELMRAQQHYLQMLQPMEPSMDLLNPASPQHNPELYFQQKQLADAMRGQVAGVQQQMQAMQAEQAREQRALTEARFSREQSKLWQVWPELRGNQRMQQAVTDAAHRFYGIDHQTIASTHDVRMFALLRDALAFRAGQQQQQQAARVVRQGIPKLVRSGARNPDASRSIRVNQAIRKAGKSGSIADAADALGLLNLS